MAWILSWLVQGLALALVARAALRMFPRLSAATRYAIWWAALLLVLLLPAMGADIGFAVPPLAVPRLPDWVVAIVIGVWLGAAMLGLVQLAHSIQVVRRLKHSCRRLTVPRESELPLWSSVRHRRRRVRLRASDCLRTAAVLGLRRPIIVVPRDMSSSLTSQEVDQVVLHEYAHVQRFDDWAKLIQVVIAAFFGWHPAVRLMLREIDREREAACDDWVVGLTGAPRAYARCLTKIAASTPASAMAIVAAIPHAASTSHFTARVERLLDSRRSGGRLAPLHVITAVAMLSVVTLCTVRTLPVATDSGSGDMAATDASALALADARPGADARVESRSTIDVGDRAAARLATATPPAVSMLSESMLSGSTLSGSMLSASMLTGSLLPDSIASPAAMRSVGTPSASTEARMQIAAASILSLAISTAPIADMTHAAAPTPSAPHHASSAAAPIERTDWPARDRAEPLPLGPVVSASESGALAAAARTADGYIERAWEAARGATSRVVGTGARAAGKATKTAATTAAVHVKTSSAKAARFIGRWSRKALPPF